MLTDAVSGRSNPAIDGQERSSIWSQSGLLAAEAIADQSGEHGLQAAGIEAQASSCC